MGLARGWRYLQISPDFLHQKAVDRDHLAVTIQSEASPVWVDKPQHTRRRSKTISSAVIYSRETLSGMSRVPLCSRRRRCNPRQYVSEL